MSVVMKNLQPLFAVLVIVLTALTFIAHSPADAAAPNTVLDVPLSGSFELAVDHAEATLTEARNCPCPSEKKEVGCSLDLCSSGIVQSYVPESRQIAAIPNLILRDDLTGIADEPDRIPPRPLV